MRSIIKRGHNVRTVGTFSAITLTAMLLFLTAPVVNHEDLAEAIGTDSATTITFTRANANLTLMPAGPGGIFASSSSEEQSQFGVKTTNYSGYTLTISASDDAGTLVNSDTSLTTNNTFSSISAVMDEKTFDSNTYNGKWGYKPSKMNSTENVGFWPSPTTTATTLDVTEQANSTDNNYTIALGARADYTQAQGIYSKTMTIAATANPSPYSVTYLDNTNDSTIKNLPDATDATANTTSISLSNVTPSRTGYIFAGWCDQVPTSSGTVCGGNVYNAGSAYPIDRTTSNIIMLYATWEVPHYDITIKPGTGISSVSLNGNSCSNATNGCVVSGLTYGQSYTLTATASTGNTFSAFYVDGLGNVANPTSASTNFVVGEGEATITAYSTISLTPTTTTMQNFTNAMCETYAKNSIKVTDSRDNRLYTVRWINGKCWMTDNLALGANPANPNTTSISINSSNTNINTSKTLTLYDLAANGASGQNCYGTYDSSTGTGTGNGYTYLCMHTSNEGNSVWYNYAAASAGTITGTANTAESTYDICPAGWRMPTHAENTAITSYTAVFSPVYGGYYLNGTLYNATTYGYWWSSTAYTGPRRYYLRYYSGSLYTTNVSRRVGFYVRCVRNS